MITPFNMATVALKTCLLLTLLTIFAVRVRSWDSDDFELFDLIEEINKNFYEVFGIDQSASTSEIRKAYRQLSLKLHPDKNDAEDAEEKFRQVVAIYEVLKDEKKRERYNQVLVEGLPDWRQPVFYYRRARKMGIYELAVVLFIILTIGHYFVAWGVYIEKRLVMEEYISTKKKKEKKKKKQAAGEEEDEDEELKSIPTPRVLDLWPFQLTVFLYHTVRNLPQTLRNWQEERARRKEEEEAAKLLEEEDDSEEFVRKPKKRAQPELPEYTNEMSAKFSTPTDGKKKKKSSDNHKIDVTGEKKGEWSDEELVLLSKAVNKFPGGTHQRWEKIADMVGRTVAEVTAKAKETKGNYVMHLSTAVQSSVSSQKSSQISDGIITQTSENDDMLLESGEEGHTDSQVRKRQKPTKIVKTAERTLLISQRNETQGASSDTNKPVAVSSCDVSTVSDVKLSPWTQNQQTIFEWALKQYPKGTDKRWDLVAEHIPGKTKEDCIARFKELATLLSKRKKQPDTKQS